MLQLKSKTDEIKVLTLKWDENKYYSNYPFEKHVVSKQTYVVRLK